MGIAQAPGRLGCIRRGRVGWLVRWTANGRRRGRIRLSESCNVSRLRADGFSRIRSREPRHLRDRLQGRRRIAAQAHPSRALRKDPWDVRAASVLEPDVSSHAAASNPVQTICIGRRGFGNEFDSLPPGDFFRTISAFLPVGIAKP